MTKQEIIEMAYAASWVFPFEDQPNPLMLSFFKDDMRINVYYTTMTVSSALKHPKHGKCQMYRRNVTRTELERLFKNPRVHLGKGYHTR